MSDRIRNWSEYNAGLKQRGSLTFWLSEDVFDEWVNGSLTGRRGASPTYSDLAIATFETLKSLYGLAGRQTEGFVSSLFGLNRKPVSME
jgi:heme-degrading monooxygenase HmoA